MLYKIIGNKSGLKGNKSGLKGNKSGLYRSLTGNTLERILLSMGKTTEVAADRAYDQSKTVLPKEVAQGVYMQHAPSLKALKLMHLMIGIAAGRMADDIRHEFRLSDVKKIDGMQNHTRTTLAPLLGELAAAVLIHDSPKKQILTIGGLLDEAKVDYRDEISGDLMVTWWFGRTFLRMAQESNHWAILDRQSVFHLGSKYSVLLFQHIASLQNLKHTNNKRFTVAEMRAILGVPEGKMPRFANLKARAIAPAIDEINSDLTRMHLTATYHKIGRTVAEVEIAWEVEEDLAKVKEELDRSSAGRRARLEGTEETPVTAFPASGTVRYTKPWEDIARANCNWDLGKLADAFRSFCKGKNIKLDARNIEDIFKNFCAMQPRL